MNPLSCQQTNLGYSYNGFSSLPPSYTQCQVPRAGCRYDYTINGVSQFTRLSTTCQPTDSFGCELPRMNENVLTTTGTCIVSSLTSSSAFSNNNNGGMCSCMNGRYGTYCEYISLQGYCFDNQQITYQNLAASTGSSTETMCVFNSYLLQYEPVSSSSVPPSILQTLPQIPCQGIMCTNIGTCVHDSMNNPQLDIYTPSSSGEVQAIQANPYTAFSGNRIAFMLQVQNRLLSQHCQCPQGYVGAYCQYRDCINGCGSGYCVRSVDNTVEPYCVCPKTATGILLVTGAQCTNTPQATCGSHGVLVNTVSGILDLSSPLPQPVYTTVPIYTCNCTAPYYQGPVTTQLCQSSCINGTLQYLTPASITATNTAAAASNIISQSSAVSQSVISSVVSGGLGPPHAPAPTHTPSPTPAPAPKSTSTTVATLTCVPNPPTPPVITHPVGTPQQSNGGGLLSSSSSSSSGHTNHSSSSSTGKKVSSSSSTGKHSNSSSSSSGINNNITINTNQWGNNNNNDNLNNPTAVLSLSISIVVVTTIVIGIGIALSKSTFFLQILRYFKIY